MIKIGHYQRILIKHTGYKTSILDIKTKQDTSSSQNWTYPGVASGYTETDTKEIEKPILQSKKVIEYLNSIFWKKNINKGKIHYKRDLCQKYYNINRSETWRIHERSKSGVEVVSIDAIIRSLCTSGKVRFGNEKRRKYSKHKKHRWNNFLDIVM